MDIRTITTAIARGDEAAFDLFYQAYADRMYRYVIVLARGEESLAQDVHADAMLKVVRYMKPFGSEDDFWRWLTRILRTTLIDHLRRRGTHPSTVPLRPEEGVEVEDSEVQDALLAHLDAALARLPEEDRDLIEAHYFDGAPQTELAERSGSTAKAVGMKLLRLRQKLRVDLLKELRVE